MRAVKCLEDSGRLESVRQALSLDAQMRAVAWGWDTDLELHHASSGELVRRIEARDSAISLAFSADGKVLATGYLGGGVVLWDVATGRELAYLDTRFDSVGAVGISTDGNTVAAGGDYTPDVPIWDSRTSNERVTLKGHVGTIRGVCFSPDSTKVATVATDGALKVWDAESGRLLATCRPLPGAGDRPSDGWITFTPDGYYAASPNADRFIRWRVDGELRESSAFDDRFHHRDRVTHALA